MSGTLTDKVINDLLNSIAANCWLSLHFDSPFIAGAYASELSGKGYGRKKASFTPASSRAIWLTTNHAWQGLAQNRITHIGGWNASLRGDLQFAVELADPKVILEGGGYSLSGGTLALSIG